MGRREIESHRLRQRCSYARLQIFFFIQNGGIAENETIICIYRNMPVEAEEHTTDEVEALWIADKIGERQVRESPSSIKPGYDFFDVHLGSR